VYFISNACAGHIPGRPQGGRHGMMFGLRQIPTSTCVGTTTATSAPLVPGSLLLSSVLLG